MATAGALASNAQLINSLLSGAKTLFGSSSTRTESTSGGTSTTQTMLSQDAVNALLKDLMEDPTSGLARVASGARVPGMYNTTSQQLMINDLLARSAAQVAEASAPTVTTTSPKTATVKTAEPSILSGNLGTAAALGAGAYGISKLLKGAGGAGSAVGDIISSSGAVDYAAMAAQDMADFGVGAVSDLGESLGFAFGTDWEAGSLIADVGGGIPWMSGINDLLSGDIGGAAERIAGATIGQILIPIPGVGSWLGANLAEPVFEVAGDILGDVVEGIFGGCFITTAVCFQAGKPDDCYELITLRNFRDTWLKENHAADIEQYYAEAPMIVSRISAREDAAIIYKQFERDYIQPAIAAIEAGTHEIAYDIYKTMFEQAKEIVGGA